MNRLSRTLRLLMVLNATCLVAILSFHANFATAQAKNENDSKYPQQILIIRHAEKTGDAGDLHLSKEGTKRAEVLYQLFAPSKDRSNPFPMPDFIFAASDSNNSKRPVETVTPFAGKIKMPIIDKYDSKKPTAVGSKAGGNTVKESGMIALRDEIFGNPKYFGKTILIAWRHSTIPDLAKTLKAGDVPSTWADEVFDRVWQITYDKNGGATFVDRPQHLLAGDREK